MTEPASPHESRPGDQPRATTWAAYAAGALALLSAVPSRYWALGGTAGLDTVGRTLEELARAHGGLLVVVGALVLTGGDQPVGAG